MSKTSEVSHGIVYKATEEERRNFNLGTELTRFMWDEPFYSRILRSLDKRETETISTAGVSCGSDNITLFWNRDFMASLSKARIKGLLIHECLHLLYKHTTERRKDPHLIWNWATDLAINSLIPIRNLPKGGLVPGRRLASLSSDDKKNMEPEQIERYYKISSLIASLEPNKTSEYYFEILKNDEDVQNHVKESTVYTLGFDEHDGWDDLSEDEKEMIDAKLNDIIKNAAEEAENKSWGSVPSSVQIELSKRFSNTISWKSVLKTFCGHKTRSERTSSIKRINRKYPGIHPGIQKKYKPKIAVYIDESGSMSSDILEMLYAELTSLSRNTEFHVYKFDVDVDEDSSFLWKKGKSVKISRSKSGGTCFNSPTKHALKNKSKFDGYIIMTDGFAPKPLPSNGLKRCWITIPNCHLMFHMDKKDTLVEMKL